MTDWFNILIALVACWLLFDNSRVVTSLTALANTAKKELLEIELPEFPEYEAPPLTRAERRRYLPAKHRGEAVERIRHRRGWR